MYATVLIRATKRGKKRMKRNKVLRGGFEPLDFASFSLSLSLVDTHKHTVYTSTVTRSYTQRTRRNTRRARARTHTRPLENFLFLPFCILLAHSISLHSLSLSYALTSTPCLFHPTAFFHPFSHALPLRPLVPLDRSPSNIYAILRWPTTFNPYPRHTGWR